MKNVTQGNIKIQVGEKLGGITAIISNDLEQVELVGIGKAVISYASSRKNPIINFIETNPYDVETNKKIAKLCDKNNIPYNTGKTGKSNWIGNDSITGFQFGLTEEQKKLIADELNRQHEEFEKAILAGKIKLTLKEIGCDFPHLVLSTDWESNGIKTWDLFYLLLEETYHIYEGWAGYKEGDDVTKIVIEKIKEKKAKRTEGEEKENKINKLNQSGAVLLIEEVAPENGVTEEEIKKEIWNSPPSKKGEGRYRIFNKNIKKEDFRRINAQYWDEEFLEECDLFYTSPGWRITQSGIKILKNSGYKVVILNKEMI